MNADDDTILLESLGSALRELDPASSAADQLERLVRDRLDLLPRPGGGSTLTRWQALAAVAAHGLSLAKLYEGHTDALAILNEVGGDAPGGPTATWGVWAAEAPQGRTVIEGRGPDVRLQGGKCWCSGAASASHALLTAWYADGTGPQLVAVAIAQRGVHVTPGTWHAVGMSGSASLDVTFEGAQARLVGGLGQYLDRPGFWQGGAGIAACWYGGAVALAETLRSTTLQGPLAARSPFRLAALGRVDLALRSTAALLREGAAWIDANPRLDASAQALRVRLAAERCASLVLAETGRALGATPFCRDAAFARMAADLPVFIRQSHGDRDLAASGERVPADGSSPWTL